MRRPTRICNSAGAAGQFPYIGSERTRAGLDSQKKKRVRITNPDTLKKT